ncbi:MAG: type II toxin-antitoxin system RelE/ParE family toxin [Pararhodobacter sp.]
MSIVTVVETPEFQRRARSLMSEDERLALIDFVARNPMTGVSIGGGVRKFRFARDGGGKSGGYRVIHFFSAEGNAPIFLITVFAKNERANLTPGETDMVKQLGAALADSYRRTR